MLLQGPATIGASELLDELVRTNAPLVSPVGALRHPVGDAGSSEVPPSDRELLGGTVRELWSDSALNHLSAWLSLQGVPNEQVADIADAFWGFYSYHLRPELGRSVPVEIMAKNEDHKLRVLLSISMPHLPTESWAVIMRSFDTELGRKFSAMGLEIEIESYRNGNVLDDATLRRQAMVSNFDYLGVYIDDLMAELHALLPQDIFSGWIGEPNPALGGLRPSELLQPEVDDRLLRDLLLRVRHGAFS